METEITGPGFRIRIPHPLPSDEEEDGNVDVLVHLDDGSHYAGTLYSVANVRVLMDRFRVSGECAAGRYFFDPTMVIVRDLKVDTIHAVIEDLIRSDELAKAFVRSDR